MSVISSRSPRNIPSMRKIIADVPYQHDKGRDTGTGVQGLAPVMCGAAGTFNVTAPSGSLTPMRDAVLFITPTVVTAGDAVVGLTIGTTPSGEIGPTKPVPLVLLNRELNKPLGLYIGQVDSTSIVTAQVAVGAACTLHGVLVERASQVDRIG